jgi:hypothetical protein
MKEKLLQSYQVEIKKNQEDLENEKKKFIDEIITINKTDIFKKTEVKLTLWQRIKKVVGF